MSQWLVPDPWPTRLREALGRYLLCPLLGHKWRQKMSGRLCDRCSIFKSDG